jgi:hypothetical protein
LSASRAHNRQHCGTGILSADRAHEKTWRCDAVTWSETNTEAFQGLPNQGRPILLVFDECSAIPDKIWSVAEGVLTDEGTEILWLVSSNPTRPDGMFFRCFHEQRPRWHGVQIDSLSVPGTNRKLFDEWEQLYGNDSDFFRVRVKGQFPRAGAMGFIQPMLVEQAMARPEHYDSTEPVVMGVDVARFGDDLAGHGMGFITGGPDSIIAAAQDCLAYDRGPHLSGVRPMNDDQHSGTPIWRFRIEDPGVADVQHWHVHANGIGLVAGRGLGPAAARMQARSAVQQRSDVAGHYRPFADMWDPARYGWWR